MTVIYYNVRTTCMNIFVATTVYTGICYAMLFTRFMTLPSPELEEVEICLPQLDLSVQ